MDPPALEDVRGLREPEGDVGELLDQKHPDAALGDGLDDRHEPLDDNRGEAE
jgi:hypothetical protein